MATFIISAILIAIIILAIRYMKKKKSTCPGCGSCNVTSCPAHKNYENKTN